MPLRSSNFDTRCRARIRSPRTSSRARTRSRAASCSTLGTDHLDELVDQQQPGQQLRIPGVGLHPVPVRPLQLRRRRHRAPHPMIGQVPVQAVAGRAGLVADVHRPRQTRHPPMHIGRIRGQLALPHLPGQPVQAHARSPTWRAHPTRRTYAHSSLRPPATCGSTGQAESLPGNPRPLASEASACSYRLGRVS